MLSRGRYLACRRAEKLLREYLCYLPSFGLKLPRTKKTQMDGADKHAAEATSFKIKALYQRTIRRRGDSLASAQALQRGASLTVVRVDLHGALVRLDSLRVVVQLF